MSDFRELTVEELTALRKFCRSNFDDRHGMDAYVNADVTETDAIDSATTLQDFLDITGSGVTIWPEHIQIYDVDNKISEQMIEHCEEGDTAEATEIFRTHYGLLYVNVSSD